MKDLLDFGVESAPAYSQLISSIYGIGQIQGEDRKGLTSSSTAAIAEFSSFPLPRPAPPAPSLLPREPLCPLAPALLT